MKDAFSGDVIFLPTLVSHQWWTEVASVEWITTATLPSTAQITWVVHVFDEEDQCVCFLCYCSRRFLRARRSRQHSSARLFSHFGIKYVLLHHTELTWEWGHVCSEGSCNWLYWGVNLVQRGYQVIGHSYGVWIRVILMKTKLSVIID